MTRSARSNRCARALPFAVALTFAVAAPALAQGTAEQREACAPDAVNLCSDTIPDVAKTTACMKRHFSQLSPRCKVAFNAATDEGGSSPAPETRTNRRAAPEDSGPAVPPGPRRYGYVDPDEDDDGLDTSRSVIAHLCNEGMIDPGTCRRTARALDMH